jgi:hypothetical protein
MAKPSKKSPKFHIKPLVELMGWKNVIDELGAKQILESLISEVGPEQIVDDALSRMSDAEIAKLKKRIDKLEQRKQ